MGFNATEERVPSRVRSRACIPCRPARSYPRCVARLLLAGTVRPPLPRRRRRVRMALACTTYGIAIYRVFSISHFGGLTPEARGDGARCRARLAPVPGLIRHILPATAQLPSRVAAARHTRAHRNNPPLGNKNVFVGKNNRLRLGWPRTSSTVNLLSSASVLFFSAAGSFTSSRSPHMSASLPSMPPRHPTPLPSTRSTLLPRCRVTHTEYSVEPCFLRPKNGSLAR